MNSLEEKIEYNFRDIRLLETALTHSSYANERRTGAGSNERLEFLGDSVLGFTVAEFLYKNKPDMPEGKMTRLRAELVCEAALHSAALSIGLGEHLLLGHGEQASNGRERPSLLADAMEAVFAAVYLDGGKRAAAKLIRRLILSRVDEAERANYDYKTALQELAQKKPGQKVQYRMCGESGPDHQKLFHVEALVGGRVLGTGEGSSKKAAEQLAARCALEALDAL